MTRREKLRQEMLEEIKATARQQMAGNGTAAISLSAIARMLGVSQPALYRYYASRDDCQTGHDA
jgi:AcrR family transcriptional regulator